MTSSLLAIDASTEACTVAFGSGERVVYRYSEQPRRHAQLILPMVDEVLAEAGVALTQVDGVAFGRGPGAFTGLRIAAGVVQGLAFALDVPVVPVSSLAIIAQRAFREHKVRRIHVAMDARMGEVYWGRFVVGDDELVEPVSKEVLSVPEDIGVRSGAVEEQNVHWFGAGSGWCYGDLLSGHPPSVKAWDQNIYPHGLDLMPLAQSCYRNGLIVSAEEAQPVYLRNKVAVKKTVSGR